MEPISYVAAFSLGLLGSAHCLGMCGGIIGALTLSIGQVGQYQRLLYLLSYNVGRIASYVSIAIIFYVLVSVPASYFSLNFMRILAGLLLIAMGLYLANWWRGLRYLEKIGGLLWKKIQPFSEALLPVRTAGQALLLGALWGWLPCGLVYSALVYSATADSVSQVALLMLSFALGTLPAVLSGSLLADKVLHLVRKKSVRAFIGILLICFGIWTLWVSVSDHSHKALPSENSGPADSRHLH